jgi:hypothetical protein
MHNILKHFIQVKNKKIKKNKKSSWWTHVKKVKGKNGRQVWRILHATLLGGDRITATESAIVTKLQSFRYEGDQKNFNFDKYVTLHVEQHNLSTVLNLSTSP